MRLCMHRKAQDLHVNIKNNNYPPATENDCEYFIMLIHIVVYGL